MASKEWYLNLMTGLSAACAVTVTSVVVYRQFVPPAAAVAPAAPSRVNRPVADWNQQMALGRRMGPDDAPLTILYYGDFECPACRTFVRVVEEIRRAHPADISVVFRHFPLSQHRFAYPSARAAECAADQAQFEAMHNALYAAQDSLGLVSYRDLARRAEVPNLNQFDVCMNSSTTVTRIERDVKAAVDTKIPGTPGVIIDGMLFLEGTPTVKDLENMVKNARRARS